MEISIQTQSFLVVTGMSRAAFARLHRAVFGQVHCCSNSQKYGFNRKAWIVAQISIIFGTVPSVASDIIMQMLELTCRKLKQHHAARIKFPTHAEMEDYSQLIQQREPTVTNVIGFIDGLSIPVECSGDVEEQAKFYNGYHHD